MRDPGAMSGQERCEPEDLLEREWEEHHPAVFGVAYRILGTVVDAEDVVQDVWLRASGAPIGEVRDLRAWLITVAARRAYDIARSARIRRETYVGPWLPEPLLTGPDAAERVLVDDALTTAMLLVLEELSPPERVAFVLQQAFEVPYARIAQVLGRSEPACRQLVSRARAKVRAARAEHTGPSASGAENASRAEKESVLAAFRAAAECGDLAGMVALLAPDATYTTMAAVPCRPRARSSWVRSGSRPSCCASRGGGARSCGRPRRSTGSRACSATGVANRSSPRPSR